MEFKDRLKQIIEILEIDNKALADLCGVGLSTIFNYLSGKTYPDAKLLKDLKNHFPQVNLDWLITGEGEPCLYNKEGSGNVVSMDPAVQMLREVEQETGVALNPKQKEAVIKILRKEIDRRNAESKAEIRDLVESFGPEDS